MSIWTALFGGGVAQPIEAVGKIIDELYTSDEEKLEKDILKQRLLQQPTMAQVELNKIEAQHRSVFVAGWRPAIGWVCALALFFFFVPQFVLGSWLWAVTVLQTGQLVSYPVGADGLFELIMALLGLGALRTIEKTTGRTK